MNNQRKLATLDRMHKIVVEDTTSTESVKMDMMRMIEEVKQQILTQIEDDSDLHQGRTHARTFQ
jgi:hypothetical protein